MKGILTIGILLAMVTPAVNFDCGNFCYADTAHVSQYTPQFGIHSDGIDLIKQFESMEEFVNACSIKNYSIILFNAIPWEYYFISPTLEKLGWEFGGNLLAPLVEEAHKRDIQVFVDVQSLAWKVREDYEDWPGRIPSTDDVVSIVNELISYGVDGISEEEFLAEWFFPVYEICTKNNVMYLHKGIPYDVAWFCNEGSTAFDTYANCSILMTEDYYMNDDLARNCIIPSFAAGLGKSYWMKSCPDKWALRSVENMENVMRMRMIQYQPDYVFAMVYNRSEFEKFNPSSLLPDVQDYVIPEEKPICNVVVYLTDAAGTENNPKDFDAWQLLDVSFSAIANGIMSSGYEIVITREPIETADAYYVYTRGGWWDETNILDLPDSIVSLLYGNKTVFLEVAANLPASTSNWQKVRKTFGIDNTIFDAIFVEYQPILGNYKGISYTHMGSDWSLFNDIRPSNVGSNILATCTHNGNTYALIIKNNNCIFINGAGLDFNASFPISNILNNGLQSTCNCIATTGFVSTFYAISDTNLNIKLPYNTTSLQWTKIDMNGNVQSGSLSYDENDGYTTHLEKGTLLLMKGERKGNITVAIERPSNALYIYDREILPTKEPLIIGKITILANITSDLGIQNAEFYIDGIMKYNDSNEPYEWLWDEYAVGKHEILVSAHSKNRQQADARTTVLIFNV